MQKQNFFSLTLIPCMRFGAISRLVIFSRGEIKSYLDVVRYLADWVHTIIMIDEYWTVLFNLKLEILSSFTHLVPNLYDFYYLFCWTQKKILWRIRITKQVMGTIDFHSFFVCFFQ